MANPQLAVETKLLEATKIVEEQIDAEIEKLEKLDIDELESLRKQRLDALKKQETKKREWLEKGHGEYSELPEEKEFFEVCKKSENVVCHFYRESTFRCKIVDKHLAALARKHIETKFCKIDVEKSPFLTDRLRIRVLPTIVLCKNAITKDFIVGFDDLGGHDEFSTEMLEWRIARAEVIIYNGDLTTPPNSLNSAKKNKPVFGYRKKNIRDDDGGDDSDED
ncbi:thioredoxin domain-containing protein 9-like [Limulus polyphemus]|uniref:Thioredoxin domain-containing protein 9 n=1 Tax=Limulus polyphemus TaxID=6850 RepID=A0ABM1BD44_LIMPO|nr:thioredoxin domain-containing protein 9-like [Limulus polyphemus]